MNNKISEHEELIINTILDKKFSLEESCKFFNTNKYFLNLIFNKFKQINDNRYELIRKQFIYKANLLRTIKGLNNNNSKLNFKTENDFLSFIETYAEKYLNGMTLYSIKLETALPEKTFYKYITTYLSSYNNDLYQKLLDNGLIHPEKYIKVPNQKTYKYNNKSIEDKKIVSTKKIHSKREEKRRKMQEEQQKINNLTEMLRKKNRIN